MSFHFFNINKILLKMISVNTNDTKSNEDGHKDLESLFRHIKRIK